MIAIGAGVGVEQRQHERRTVTLQVRIEAGMGEAPAAETMQTRDVSEGGVFLYVTDPPGVGTTLTLHLRLGGKFGTLPLAGTVVHSLPGVGMGVAFHSEHVANEILVEYLGETT